MENNINGWGDRALYHIPMTNLNFYHNGKCCTKDGIDAFTYGGETFKSCDIVVVGGGVSYEYDKCIKNPHDWEMWSGFRCSMNGLRHATEEEIEKYEISANLTADAAEAADNAYKEKRIWGLNGRP